MPIDLEALREKLDAMKRRADAVVPDGSEAGKWKGIAMFLLYEKEQRETPCVWSIDEIYATIAVWRGSCGKEISFYENERILANDFKFCPGCGHPVQVKQNEEE